MTCCSRKPNPHSSNITLGMSGRASRRRNAFALESASQFDFIRFKAECQSDGRRLVVEFLHPQHPVTAIMTVPPGYPMEPPSFEMCDAQPGPANDVWKCVCRGLCDQWSPALHRFNVCLLMVYSEADHVFRECRLIAE